MPKMARGIQRRVEVDNIKPISARTYQSQYLAAQQQGGDTHEASATSLPEGEIVADPTLRST